MWLLGDCDEVSEVAKFHGLRSGVQCRCSIAERALLVCTASVQIGARAAPNYAFTLAGGRLPCSSFWGLAPMVLRGRACDRAGLMRLRCLIVDDNASFREEMRGLLAEQGLDVVGGAGSAADAHRQIAELRPDVALIDIDLGGESGLELARQLREQPGQGAVPRLILISTHDEAEYADLIEASSAIGFLAKIDLSAATIRQMLAAVDGDKADES
jgi:CheY-like chemotaxis protein